MTDDTFAVYGASGMGREAMPLLRQTLRRAGVDPHNGCVVFVDDHPEADVVNGHDVMTFSSFVERPGAKHVSLAVADAGVRRLLAARCEEANVSFLDVRADNAMILDGNEIGTGSILCGFSSVTSNARIGRHFHANIYSYIAHDCRIGDFVTLAPGAKVNGLVVLEDDVYVGTGAVIRQGTPDRPMVIGKGAVIGMGAVVTKSVPPGTTVVGNPARPLVSH